MTNQLSTRSTTEISIRPAAVDLELRTVGTVPWSLEGAYLTMSPLVPTQNGAGFAVESVVVARDRCAAYFCGRISIASRVLRQRFLSPVSGGTERASAVRCGAEILINVPSYGVIALPPDFAAASTKYLVKEGHSSLLFEDPTLWGPCRCSHAMVVGSDLVCRLKGKNLEQRFPLGSEAANVRRFGATGGHVVVTALPDVCDDVQGGRLGVASTDSPRTLRWFPIELARSHQLIDIHRDDPQICVWISEAHDDRPCGRIRLWSLNLERDTLTCLASYDIPARGPFSLERVGAEAKYLYGLGSDGERRARSTLVRLDLDTGEIDVSAGDFGSSLGSPTVAQENRAPTAPRRSWLVVPVYDAVRDRTDLTIREARDLRRQPIAFLQLPSPSALGSEGAWI